MRKSRFTEEQILAALKQHAAGASTKELCRQLKPKTAPQCTREPYTAGVLEAPAGYSGQAARTGRTAFMSGPVFGGRSSEPESTRDTVRMRHYQQTRSSLNR